MRCEVKIINVESFLVNYFLIPRGFLGPLVYNSFSLPISGSTSRTWKGSGNSRLKSISRNCEGQATENLSRMAEKMWGLLCHRTKSLKSSIGYIGGQHFFKDPQSLHFPFVSSSACPPRATLSAPSPNFPSLQGNNQRQKRARFSSSSSF